jgi:hypothetical protein
MTLCEHVPVLRAQNASSAAARTEIALFTSVAACGVVLMGVAKSQSEVTFII